MRNGEGSVIVIDWKRSRSISMDNDRANMKYPLQHSGLIPNTAQRIQAVYPSTRALFMDSPWHLPASNYWAYALQVPLTSSYA